MGLRAVEYKGKVRAQDSDLLSYTALQGQQKEQWVLAFSTAMHQAKERHFY